MPKRRATDPLAPLAVAAMRALGTVTVRGIARHGSVPTAVQSAFPSTVQVGVVVVWARRQAPKAPHVPVAQSAVEVAKSSTEGALHRAATGWVMPATTSWPIAT